MPSAKPSSRAQRGIPTSISSIKTGRPFRAGPRKSLPRPAGRHGVGHIAQIPAQFRFAPLWLRLPLPQPNSAGLDDQDVSANLLGGDTPKRFDQDSIELLGR
jgi:hypothetical protein